MVKKISQGDIIKINLNPKEGHEEMGYRPYICLSNNLISKYSNVAVFAAISNTKRKYPYYISLKNHNTITKGSVLLDQIVTIDFNYRKHDYIESVNEILLEELLSKARTVFDEI
ncbi:growth inhibitor PemK [Floricoccus penangensis]|uniref:Growth inhibitor PemK n=1 Tax=Floricoccus penangensis TaxID=1859475 RepID=A0A9Q5JF52_9LACT|nr:type II toxin-antitoxin system PemK/MazF family toxin [Floricoccus penangensis]OFI46165.1 growth inhibitor PemK [Floricoccus penangensis]